MFLTFHGCSRVEARIFCSNLTPYLNRIFPLLALNSRTLFTYALKTWPGFLCRILRFVMLYLKLHHRGSWFTNYITKIAESRNTFKSFSTNRNRVRIKFNLMVTSLLYFLHLHWLIFFQVPPIIEQRFLIQWLHIWQKVEIVSTPIDYTPYNDLIFSHKNSNIKLN